METDTPGIVFDLAVKASLERCARAAANMTTSPISAKRLTLLKEPRRYPDDTPRELAEIDERLRAAIRGLVNGELEWPFFVTGLVGRGKSAAALCLVDYVADSIYFRFTRLLKHFEWARNGNAMIPRFLPASTSADEKRIVIKEEPMDDRKFWNYLMRSPLVVVDDIATRTGYSDPQYDQFYDLVEGRKLKPTVFVSNLALPELAKVFDERIASRIAAGTIFTLSGRDRRILRKGLPCP